MKILIIPDVHGRDFWIEPCEHIDEFDKVIFLGDYHDPYTFQVSKEVSRKLLKTKLVPFVEQHKNKVICLFGNHDGNYIVGDMADRMDYQHRMEILHLLERMNLKLIYQVDGYLFSHSGVLPTWLSEFDLSLEDLDTLSFKDIALRAVSPRRGGTDTCGSCIWGDAIEYDQAYHLADIYQIFGHTQLQHEYVSKDFACLDCRKAFVLNTETKKLVSFDEYNNNEEEIH